MFDLAMVHRRVDDPFDLMIAHHVDRPHLDLRIIASVEQKQELAILPGRLLCANDDFIAESILGHLIGEKANQL